MVNTSLTEPQSEDCGFFVSNILSTGTNWSFFFAPFAKSLAYFAVSRGLTAKYAKECAKYAKVRFHTVFGIQIHSFQVYSLAFLIFSINCLATAVMEA